MEEKIFYDEYEIDLREYIILLWRKKWIIAAFFMVCVLAAGFYSFFLAEPVYETNANILTPSFILLDNQYLSKDDDNLSYFYKDDYLLYLRSPELEQQVIEKFELNKENPDFNIENLDKILSIKTEKESNIVTLTLINTNPLLVRDMLNYWIERFNNQVQQYISSNNREYLNKLETQYKELEEKYLAAQKELTNFEKNINLELMKARLNSKQNQLVNYEVRVDNLNTSFKKLNEEYKIVTQQLEKTKEFIITKETIDDRSMETLKNLLFEDKVAGNLSTEIENLNSIYIGLESKKNDLEQSITSTQTELELLISEINELESKIAVLKSQIAENEEKEILIRKELEIAKRIFSEAEAEYNNGLQFINKTIYQISIIKKPVLLQSPISPNKKLNVAIAGVLGLMLGIFAVFFAEFMKKEDEVETAQSNGI